MGIEPRDPIWQGTVTDSILEGRHGRLVIEEPKWAFAGGIPKVGCIVEIRVVYRSPYWTLVDEDE